MSTKGTILLAVGMLVLGLILGVGVTLVGTRVAGRTSFGAFAQLGRGVTPLQQFADGARVVDVEANSPAAKAGLQRGDTITAVGGTKVDANNSLADLIAKKKPGDKVDLTVTRGTQTLTINVELGTSPTNNSAAYLGIRYGPSAPAQRRPSSLGSDAPTG
ncbi:MAG: PDZ domain-containing protein [Chloroflexi bacterium]|nr:PDZ domain-containing protein [Chloroflexota bacterium]MBI3740204.1 PDZ domain-containing protein [Chloroflexota bacterium]